MTTASGARRCATTTPTASTATAATASTRTATTRPSAASTKRARATRSAARPTAARTRCRSPRTWPSTASSVASSSTANINYHSAGQLLLTPVSYTTDYYPPDSTLFDAITGTDGDEAVFPYRSQHSSDLYESNGDTIDNAYMNYGIIGWTPEMDTCATLGEPSGCNQFASPDDEENVKAVFNKNLAFALNVTKSLPNLGRPKNFENDPSQLPGQGRPRTSSSTASTCPTAAAARRGHGPQGARPGVHHGDRRRPERQLHRPHGGRARRRALQRGQGLLLRASPRDHPGHDRHPRPPGRRHRERRSSRPAVSSRSSATASRPRTVDATKKRVLVVAAEDYTGEVAERERRLRHARRATSPSTSPPWRPPATRSRRLQHRRAARRTAARRTRHLARRSSTRRTSACSRTSTRSTTTRATTSPRRISTETNPRRLTSATAQTGSHEMAPGRTR